MGVKEAIPWWIKIVVKIVLTRLPVPYSTWQKIGIFRLGAMDDPEYAYNTFEKLFKFAYPDKTKADFIVLEIGPGDSIYSGIVAHSFGAKETILVDAGDFAKKDNRKLSKIKQYINERLRIAIYDINTDDYDEILSHYNICYLTEGINSLRGLPDNSIDYLWSRSVLEHIRKNEYRDLIKETRRVLKDDGLCAHGVDLKDHLAYGLNNLRFSEDVWESEFMANSGFYTNRLRYSEIIKIFKEEGLDVVKTELTRWESLPIKRKYLHAEFAVLPDEELMISSFDILLKPSK